VQNLSTVGRAGSAPSPLSAGQILCFRQREYGIQEARRSRPATQAIRHPRRDTRMSTNTLISYVFLIAGLVDFIVVPRVLLGVWRRQGPPEATRAKLVRMLRLSGLALIVIGVLFFYQILSV